MLLLDYIGINIQYTYVLTTALFAFAVAALFIGH